MSETLNALGEAIVASLPGAVTGHAIAFGETRAVEREEPGRCSEAGDQRKDDDTAEPALNARPAMLNGARQSDIACHVNESPVPITRHMAELFTDSGAKNTREASPSGMYYGTWESFESRAIPGRVGAA